MITQRTGKSHMDYLVVIDGYYYPKCATCDKPIQDGAMGGFVADELYTPSGMVAGFHNWRFTHRECNGRQGPYHDLRHYSIKMFDQMYGQGAFENMSREDTLELLCALNRVFKPQPVRRLPNQPRTLTTSIPPYRGVYLIKCHERHKIGRAKNVRNRVETIASYTPYDVEFVHSIRTNDDDILERTLHTRFASKRVRGEWFALSDSDVAYIKGL